MLVYDSTSTSNTASAFECTYTTFQSNHSTATPEHPILILDNSSPMGTGFCRYFCKSI